MISGITQQVIDTPDGAAAAVLTLRGELDLSAIALLDAAARSALAAVPAPPRLIVDLSEASVLHPIVLGVLLDARRRCRAGGGRLALIVTAPDIAATLTETGVESLFELTAGLPQAMQRVSSR